ncbi:MAG: hypothetical protein AABW83_00100 [Nanoarchaeota archaeon]
MKYIKKLTKKEIEDKLKKIFSLNPNKIQIKKAKNLAMSKNIKLKDYKKLFCKKCFNCFNSDNQETRIKNSLKIIKCKNCGYINKYNLANALGRI